jgi:hypothetical protein
MGVLMSDPRIDLLIDQLITDENFRNQFLKDRNATVEALGVDALIKKELLTLDVDDLLNKASSTSSQMTEHIGGHIGGTKPE